MYGQESAMIFYNLHYYFFSWQIMNIKENILEGIRSIKGNKLRTILTALIISFGITALVGILTAIDGIQSSVNNSFSSLGANSFDIRNQEKREMRNNGRQRKVFPDINYYQAKKYKQEFSDRGNVTISTKVTGSAIIKYGSEKTNPNASVVGVDDEYIKIKGFKIDQGRYFNKNEIENARTICIIGHDVVTELFKGKDPIDETISVSGLNLKVIGVLEKKGNTMGGGNDRVVWVPLETGRNLAAGKSLTFDITTSSEEVTDIDDFMEEARGVMRLVRMDQVGEDDSFIMERADSVAQSFDSITGGLRIGGFVVGFVTLLGASIALMNIMMVSVTERTREIGIRKSLGATPNKILFQFLIEAIVICILGGLGGFILAIPIGNLIAALISNGSASFIFPWAWMILGIIVCVLVGLFSGIYPAKKAASLDPVESLRYE